MARVERVLQLRNTPGTTTRHQVSARTVPSFHSSFQAPILLLFRPWCAISVGLCCQPSSTPTSSANQRTWLPSYFPTPCLQLNTRCGIFGLSISQLVPPLLPTTYLLESIPTRPAILHGSFSSRSHSVPAPDPWPHHLPESDDPPSNALGAPSVSFSTFSTLVSASAEQCQLGPPSLPLVSTSMRHLPFATNSVHYLHRFGALAQLATPFDSCTIRMRTL